MSRPSRSGTVNVSNCWRALPRNEGPEEKFGTTGAARAVARSGELREDVRAYRVGNKRVKFDEEPILSSRPRVRVVAKKTLRTISASESSDGKEV